MADNQVMTLDDSGWGSAFRIGWNNLTGVNDDSSVRGMRFLFFIIFISGAFWAGYCYYQAELLLEEKYFAPSTSPATLDQDKKRLDSLINQVRSSINLRKQSFVWVNSMRDQEKYVFEDPLKKEIPRDAGVIAPQVEIAVDLPPEVVVRAIMKIGKQQMAVMDIVGVGVGVIVKPGDTFMNKKGKVMRIDSDKVVVQWAGKNWDMLPGLQ